MQFASLINNGAILGRCDLYRADDCTFFTYVNMNVYRPSKSFFAYTQLFTVNSIENCSVSSCSVTTTQYGTQMTPEIIYDSTSFALTAKMDIMAGYFKQLKMTCTSDTGLTFENGFSMT